MTKHLRLSGWALIAGSVGILVTLVLHPNERGLFDPSQIESVRRTTIIVHSVALFALPLLFMGALGISRRIGWDSASAVAALIIYAFALGAMMNAIVIDGLVTPGLARAIVNAGPGESEAWKIALNHNGLLDASFMNVFLMASSLAIVLWSVAIVRRGAFARAIGILGFLLSAGTIIALVTGLLSRNLHLFLLVLVGQAIWFLSNGVQLCRSNETEPSHI
jgi:hypothetical protein